MSFTSEEKLWAGSDAGYEIALKAETAMLARTDFETQDAPLGSRLLRIENGLATISVNGPLVNSDSPLLDMFGLVGYPEIDASILEAARNTDVQQILLSVSSGGGSVSGVESTADLISTVNKIKPVTAYAHTAASAAYWMVSSAGQIYAGKTAMIGSVGVSATHRQFVEANKKDGIGVTVIRSGSEKALANSHEKLGAGGESQIKQAVMATHDIFFDHVVAKRGLNREAASKTVGQSREFIGQAAVDAGLVDGIASYAQVVSDLQRKIVDKSVKRADNRGKASNNALSGEIRMAHKETLSEQEVAALSAGVDLSASTEAASDPVIPEAQTPATQASQDRSLSMLMAQIQTKDDALLQAGIKVAKLEEKLADGMTTRDPLRAIAIKSLGTMRIALGGSALSMDGASDAELVAEHRRISEQFTSKFKAGGVVAVTTDADVEKKVEFKMTNVIAAQMRALNG